MERLLKIHPRYVKQDEEGLRPFQRQALETIKKSNARLIFACPEQFDQAHDRQSRRIGVERVWDNR